MDKEQQADYYTEHIQPKLIEVLSSAAAARLPFIVATQIFNPEINDFELMVMSSVTDTRYVDPRFKHAVDELSREDD